MIQLTNTIIFIINFFFILYILFLKYKNKKLSILIIKFKKTILNYYNDQTKYITSIQNLENNITDLKNKEHNTCIKYDDMLYEFNLYKEMISKLQNENNLLSLSEKKYKKLYKKCKINKDDLEYDSKQLNNNMDKLAHSYKDLYKSRNKLINNNANLLKTIDETEQEKCEIDSELFMFKNNMDSFKNRILLLEKIEENQKIEILKLRNILKKYNK